MSLISFRHTNEITYGMQPPPSVRYSTSAFEEEWSTYEDNESNQSDFHSISPDDLSETLKVASASAISSFNELVEVRKQYLKSLTGLRNWCSGESKNPTSEAVSVSQKILDYLRQYIAAGDLPVIPKLVMGPILSGGVAIEVHSNDEDILLFNVDNEKGIEIEISIGGNYHSASLQTHRLQLDLPDYYDRLTF